MRYGRAPKRRSVDGATSLVNDRLDASGQHSTAQTRLLHRKLGGHRLKSAQLLNRNPTGSFDRLATHCGNHAVRRLSDGINAADRTVKYLHRRATRPGSIRRHLRRWCRHGNRSFLIRHIFGNPVKERCRKIPFACVGQHHQHHRSVRGAFGHFHCDGKCGPP